MIAALCAAAGWWMGDVLAGCAFGTALFMGREHAQAEYRWIERFAGGLRANMPWWGGFDYVVWNFNSLGDWFVPCVACAGIWWFSYC